MGFLSILLTGLVGVTVLSCSVLAQNGPSGDDVTSCTCPSLPASPWPSTACGVTVVKHCKPGRYGWRVRSCLAQDVWGPVSEHCVVTDLTTLLAQATAAELMTGSSALGYLRVLEDYTRVNAAAFTVKDLEDLSKVLTLITSEAVITGVLGFDEHIVLLNVFDLVLSNVKADVMRQFREAASAPEATFLGLLRRFGASLSLLMPYQYSTANIVIEPVDIQAVRSSEWTVFHPRGRGASAAYVHTSSLTVPSVPRQASVLFMYLTDSLSVSDTPSGYAGTKFPLMDVSVVGAGTANTIAIPFRFAIVPEDGSLPTSDFTCASLSDSDNEWHLGKCQRVYDASNTGVECACSDFGTVAMAPAAAVSIAESVSSTSSPSALKGDRIGILLPFVVICLAVAAFIALVSAIILIIFKKRLLDVDVRQRVLTINLCLAVFLWQLFFILAETGAFGWGECYGATILVLLFAYASLVFQPFRPFLAWRAMQSMALLSSTHRLIIAWAFVVFSTALHAFIDAILGFGHIGELSRGGCWMSTVQFWAIFFVQAAIIAALFGVFCALLTLAEKRRNTAATLEPKMRSFAAIERDLNRGRISIPGAIMSMTVSMLIWIFAHLFLSGDAGHSDVYQVAFAVAALVQSLFLFIDHVCLDRELRYEWYLAMGGANSATYLSSPPSKRRRQQKRKMSDLDVLQEVDVDQGSFSKDTGKGFGAMSSLTRMSNRLKRGLRRSVDLEWDFEAASDTDIQQEAQAIDAANRNSRRGSREALLMPTTKARRPSIIDEAIAEELYDDDEEVDRAVRAIIDAVGGSAATSPGSAALGRKPMSRSDHSKVELVKPVTSSSTSGHRVASPGGSQLHNRVRGKSPRPFSPRVAPLDEAAHQPQQGHRHATVDDAPAATSPRNRQVSRPSPRKPSPAPSKSSGSGMGASFRYIVNNIFAISAGRKQSIALNPTKEVDDLEAAGAARIGGSIHGSSSAAEHISKTAETVIESQPTGTGIGTGTGYDCIATLKNPMQEPSGTDAKAANAAIDMPSPPPPASPSTVSDASSDSLTERRGIIAPYSVHVLPFQQRQNTVGFHASEHHALRHDSSGNQQQYTAMKSIAMPMSQQDNSATPAHKGKHLDNPSKSGRQPLVRFAEKVNMIELSPMNSQDSTRRSSPVNPVRDVSDEAMAADSPRSTSPEAL